MSCQLRRRHATTKRRMDSTLKAVFCLAAASILTLSAAAEQRGGSDQVAALLNRIGDRVEHYYARAQSVMCLETVRLQPMASDFAPAGRVRELGVRVSRGLGAGAVPDVPPEPTVTRVIRTVDGRPPRRATNPDASIPRPSRRSRSRCCWPAAATQHAFSWGGTGRTDRRATVMLDYKTLASPVSARPQSGAASVSAFRRDRRKGEYGLMQRATMSSGWTSAWSGSSDVPIPRELTRPGGPGWLTVERADSSIRYRPVTFHDPDETVMLPHFD